MVEFTLELFGKVPEKDLTKLKLQKLLTTMLEDPTFHPSIKFDNELNVYKLEILFIVQLDRVTTMHDIMKQYRDKLVRILEHAEFDPSTIAVAGIRANVFRSETFSISFIKDGETFVFDKLFIQNQFDFVYELFKEAKNIRPFVNNHSYVDFSKNGNVIRLSYLDKCSQYLSELRNTIKHVQFSKQCDILIDFKDQIVDFLPHPHSLTKAHKTILSFSNIDQVMAFLSILNDDFLTYLAYHEDEFDDLEIALLAYV